MLQVSVQYETQGNTLLFNMSATGWLKLIKGEFVAQAKEIGINSFVYRARFE